MSSKPVNIKDIDKNQLKKLKEKAKKRGIDLQTLMDEGVEVENQAATDECLAESPASPAADSEPPAAAPPANAEDATPKILDIKDLNKNQLKKLKEKAKKRGVDLQTLLNEGHADQEEAGISTPAAPAAAATKKKEKPLSRMAQLALKRREEEDRLEEERRLFEEEERLKTEAFEAKQKAEAQELETKREAKRKARKEKVERQKREGTFMTKAEREKHNQLLIRRKMFEETRAQMVQAQSMAPSQKAKAENTPAAEAQECVPEELAVQKKDEDDWSLTSEEESAHPELPAAAPVGEDLDAPAPVDPVLRSPIICILGHVDTGKTKLLDKIRATNVQLGEAGGITQQIGATYFPHTNVESLCHKVNPIEVNVPGLLVIDTPGHESFSNLRQRGSSLCDMAILVVDIMHGLEKQTLESINLLRQLLCPFVIALNKIDRLAQFQVSEEEFACSRTAMKMQDRGVQQEFEYAYERIMVELQENGINSDVYWLNEDARKYVNVVPTSAITGCGIPDLLYNVVSLCQSPLFCHRIKQDLVGFSCHILEVKPEPGMGFIIDVILTKGSLEIDEEVVVCTAEGAVNTRVRALLTPEPMKEFRVKSDYVRHKRVEASMGLRVSALHLEHVVAGTSLRKVIPNGPSLEELKEEAEDELEEMLDDFDLEEEGVYVMSSTLGSLEALMSFLGGQNVPVSATNIGSITKMHVKKAALMHGKDRPELALILAFNVKVDKAAREVAEEEKVLIFEAEIIYHLWDMYEKHINEYTAVTKAKLAGAAIFPARCSIIEKFIFNKKQPFIAGLKVEAGKLRVGTPLIAQVDAEHVMVGRVSGIEKDKKTVAQAKAGDEVCVKIEPDSSNPSVAYGRHFDHKHMLVSKLTRKSINALKDHFRDEMQKDDWKLVVELKNLFKIV